MTNRPEIDVKKLQMPDHTIKRAIERFGCKDKNEATHYVKSRLGRAKYIGVTSCEYGNRTHMYCVDGMGVHVSLDCEQIVTVLNLENYKNYDDLKPTIKEMYFKEFRKADRQEQSGYKKLKYIGLKNEAEIANLNFRMYKTRSNNVKQECELKIKELENEIELAREVIRQIEAKKRRIARAIATVI